MTNPHAPFAESATHRMLHARAELARKRLEDRSAGLVIPAPVQPATGCTGAEPWFPGGARSWLNLAKKHGWWAKATSAIGPRIGASGAILEAECRSVAVALAGPNGERIVAAYRWAGPGPKDWAIEDVQDRRTGDLLGAKAGKAIIAATASTVSADAVWVDLVSAIAATASTEGT